jgi:hypothetical protein
MRPPTRAYTQLSAKLSSHGSMPLSVRAGVVRMATGRWVGLVFSPALRTPLSHCLVGIPVTKKKFAELELSLLHLQQNVEIPETHLVIHPVIQKAVDQVRTPPPLTSLFIH